MIAYTSTGEMFTVKVSDRPTVDTAAIFRDMIEALRK